MVARFAQKNKLFDMHTVVFGFVLVRSCVLYTTPRASLEQARDWSGRGAIPERSGGMEAIAGTAQSPTRFAGSLRRI